MQGWKTDPTAAELETHTDSRFFCFFQLHKIQAAMMIRKTVRSATKPGKMSWPFFLGGKPGVMLQVATGFGFGNVGDDISFRRQNPSGTREAKI